MSQYIIVVIINPLEHDYAPMFLSFNILFSCLSWFCYLFFLVVGKSQLSKVDYVRVYVLGHFFERANQLVNVNVCVYILLLINDYFGNTEANVWNFIFGCFHENRNDRSSNYIFRGVRHY
jgi:hypothetical protein